MNEVGAGDGGGGVSDGAGSAPVSDGGSGGTALVGQATAVASPGSANGTTVSSVSIPDNWKEAISQEFRDDPSLKPIQNLESLVKSYVHSQKMIGRGKMSVPDEHASDADWRQVYQTLGLPEKSEDYSFDIPKTANFEDGFITALKDVGFKEGILPKQMKGLIEWYSEANNKAIESHENHLKAVQTESLSKLKAEWGQAFDQRLGMAKAAIKASGVDDAVYDWLNETGLGDDPQMIKLLSAMGQMLKEDGMVGEFGEQVASPKDLEARADELRQSDAYMNRSHPNHTKVLKEMEGLFAQMHPKKQDGSNSLMG